jgi:molecular chaperone Hsp33
MISDSLIRFLLGNGEVRGQIVRIENSWQEIAARHPDVVGLNCLGELSAAANLLAASLKFDGDLILQIHGQGAIKLMVVECRPEGLFRATLKLSENVSMAPDAGLSELVNQGGKGRFIVTLEPSKTSINRQPYQGIVPFEGTSVAEVLENYMERSEQVPSRLYLAANSQRAVGLLLQKMPGEGGSAGPQDADAWQRVQMLAKTVKPQELLNDTLDELLHKLFWQENLQTLDQREIRFSCTCSRDKVIAMLKMLGQDEVQSIIAEQGEVKTQCDFCNTEYRFDPVDATAVFIEGVMPASEKKI